MHGSMCLRVKPEVSPVGPDLTATSGYSPSTPGISHYRFKSCLFKAETLGSQSQNELEGTRTSC